MKTLILFLGLLAIIVLCGSIFWLVIMIGREQEHKDKEEWIKVQDCTSWHYEYKLKTHE